MINGQLVNRAHRLRRCQQICLTAEGTVIFRQVRLADA
jgi:hypothetical protein